MASRTLSSHEESLWLTQTLWPHSHAYNVTLTWRLAGRLNDRALEEALVELSRRHAALRTVFVADGHGRPTRVVLENPGEVERHDFGGLDAEGARAASEKVLGDAAAQAFDLSAAPPVRFLLTREESEVHWLQIVMHHIVVDEWTVGILEADLVALYRRRTVGEATDLEEAPASTDFILATIDGTPEERAAARAYWARTLNGSTTRVNISRASSSDVMKGEPSRVRERLTSSTFGAAASAARETGASWFAAAMASLASVIHLYSGQSDFVIGTPSAHRPTLETQEVAGYLLATLPVRFVFSAGDTLRDIVERTSEALLDAREYQCLGLAEILRCGSIADAAFAFAPFDVWFAATGEDADLELGDLKAERYVLPGDTIKFPISVFLGSEPDGPVLELEYETGGLTERVARGILEAYLDVLELLGTAIDTRLASIQLVGAVESERLRQLGDGGPPAGLPCPLVELVEQRAAEDPKAIAASSADESLSYEELNALANAASATLRRAGVLTSEDAVGLCFQRGLNMLVAVLAVTKAGAHYIALDPDLPPSRWKSIVSSARPMCVMCDSSTVELVIERNGLPVEVTDFTSLGDEVDHVAVANYPRPRPDDLAYVTFTSGSTGIPKGIAMSQGAVDNLIAWHLAMFETRSLNLPRTAQFASLSFDMSYEEIFSTWAAGAELVVISEAERRDPAALAHCMRAASVERILLPAPVFSRLATHLRRDGARLPELRTLVSASEQLELSSDVRWFMREHPDCTFYNEYGPSETHVATCHEIRTPDDSYRVPIGVPLPGTRLSVCDEFGRLLPDGAVGELLIAGVGVARGYVGMPAATAAKFIPDPSGMAGERRYRTGDLARWRDDGTLEFLGRSDFQLKIRGFRVEPGEIEATLEAHVDVARVVALSRDNGDSISVFIVPQSQTSGLNDVSNNWARYERLESALRDQVQRALPQHMWPASYVFVESLPLTPIGKVDRAALLSMEVGAGSVNARPLDDVEEMICHIWAQVLGCAVAPDADFFGLGGHSLSAASVIARLRSRYEIELPISALFEHRTPRSLARLVCEATGSKRRAGAGPIRANRMKNTRASFAQERLWVLARLFPTDTAYNIADIFELRGYVDTDALVKAFKITISRHDALLSVFEECAGEVIQRCGIAESPTLKVEDAGSLIEARHQAEMDAERSFDLETGPLIRAGVAICPDKMAVFWLVVHHIVSDDWSHRLLVRQLSDAYASIRIGLPCATPSRSRVTYGDFATWQRRQWSLRRDEGELEYWKRVLHGFSGESPLQPEFERQETVAHRAATVSFRLIREVSQPLLEIGREEGASTFMVLLAVYSASILRLTGITDFAVAVPVANRDRVETEDVVGLFVNTVVVRITAGLDSTFRDLLHIVRTAVLGALAHQEAPFEELVAALRPARDLTRNPLVQVLFQSLNVGAENGSGLRLGDVAGERVRGSASHTRLDVEWHLHDVGGAFSGEVIYAADLYGRATAQRWVDTFLATAVDVAASPEAALADSATQATLFSPHFSLRERLESQVRRWEGASDCSHERSWAARANEIVAGRGGLRSGGKSLLVRADGSSADLPGIVAGAYLAGIPFALQDGRHDAGIDHPVANDGKISHLLARYDKKRGTPLGGGGGGGGGGKMLSELEIATILRSAADEGPMVLSRGALGRALEASAARLQEILGHTELDTVVMSGTGVGPLELLLPAATGGSLVINRSGELDLSPWQGGDSVLIAARPEFWRERIERRSLPVAPKWFALITTGGLSVRELHAVAGEASGAVMMCGTREAPEQWLFSAVASDQIGETGFEGLRVRVLPGLQAKLLTSEFASVPTGTPGELFVDASWCAVSIESLTPLALDQTPKPSSAHRDTVDHSLIATGGRYWLRDDGTLIATEYPTDARLADGRDRVGGDTVKDTLVAIWLELFDTREIQDSDDFFDIGGHSMMAVHLVDLVKERLGVEMPVTDVFRLPTIETMSQSLIERLRDGTQTDDRSAAGN